MSITSPNRDPATTSVRFWGVRGSIPTPGPSTARYGGNTTCIEVRTGGELIVIDAGSGMRDLGMALLQEYGREPIHLTLLHSHAHWDHIQGFPFFAPAYGSQTHIRIIGGNATPEGLPRVFADQMDGQRYFPVPFAALPARISFEHLDARGELRCSIGDVEVSACPTNHPGGSLGYRLETSRGAIVFLSDHETGGADEDRIRSFIAGAALMIADAQYDASEIASRRGWGHGSVDEVVELAASSGVARVYLFHHDPAHDDARLDRMLAEGRSRGLLLRPDLLVDAAREGEEIVL